MYKRQRRQEAKQKKEEEAIKQYKVTFVNKVNPGTKTPN